MPKKSGAPKGNTNAHKHGFYSRAYNTSEQDADYPSILGKHNFSGRHESKDRRLHDKFMIQIPSLNGYSAGGSLTGGNIQITVPWGSCHHNWICNH